MNLYKFYVLLVIAIVLFVLTSFGCRNGDYFHTQRVLVEELPCRVIVVTEVFKHPVSYRYDNAKLLWQMLDTVCYDRLEEVKAERTKQAVDMLNTLNPKVVD